MIAPRQEFSAVPSETKSRIRTVVGPVHPALKEPIKLVFELEGEKVVDVDFVPGHAHRGIEWMGTRRNCVQIIHTSERICGICGVSHSLSFCRAVEQAAGISVPPRAEYLRTIYGELERMHSHLLWAGVAALELGFDTLFYKAWEVREKVMDLLEYLSGNRVNYGTLQVGGMRRDITPDQYDKVRESLDYYAGIFDELAEMFLEDTVLKSRCRDTGVLPRDEAVRLCTVGPNIRASGIPTDVRQDHPYWISGSRQ
jgi:membrane-bound hydrogenase subunit alpha